MAVLAEKEHKVLLAAVTTSILVDFNRRAECVKPGGNRIHTNAFEFDHSFNDPMLPELGSDEASEVEISLTAGPILPFTAITFLC